MCISNPKLPKDKPPVYLVNPLLNGLQVGRDTGRSSLVTDLPGPGVKVPNLAIPGAN